MARACTVCGHKEREQIEKAIEAREALRTLAERYGVSAAALHRHKGHMEEKTEDTKKRWDPEKDPVPKPPISNDPEMYPVSGLGLVCPKCGEMEIYFAGWVDDRTAAIECPWCNNKGYIKDLTIGDIALTVDSAVDIARGAPMPPWREKKKQEKK